MTRNGYLGLLFGAVLASGCALLAPARTANHIARDLCALHYSEREGLSLEDAAETFCKDLRPWLDLVLRTQREGVSAPEPAPADAGPDASDAGAE